MQQTELFAALSANGNLRNKLINGLFVLYRTDNCTN